MHSKTKLILVVDGKTEKALLRKIDQTNFKVSFVQRRHNGSSVTMELIASECAGILNTYYSSGTQIVLIIDRENREMTDSTMESQLREIIKQKFSGDYEIVVANQMFENWILSDIENVSKTHSSILNFKKNHTSHEGTNGTKILDQIWIPKRNECYSSDKISHAQLLFKSVRSDVGKTFSSSFKKFSDILERFKVTFY